MYPCVTPLVKDVFAVAVKKVLSAVAKILSVICAGVRLGKASFKSAIDPAIQGAPIEFPLIPEV